MTPTPSAPEPDWFADSFGALYPIVYAHRSIGAARPEAFAAIKRLHLSEADEVLDLCCGTGRHMTHLLKCTSSLVGLDYSPDLLAIARQTLGRKGRLIRADMRSIPFEDAFDAIVNFFTSFGYFQTHDENLAVVRGVARALRPGGRFFIDHVNQEYVRRTLEPYSQREAGEYAIVEQRWISEEDHRVNKTTVVYRGGQEVHTFMESVRLYAHTEFLELLEAGGLTATETMGDYPAAPFDADHPRMICIGHKK